ncbi:unnamed protein product, partial [Didymodactylos carnosus]
TTAPKARACDLGIPFNGQTGKHNTITDVSGIETDHTTLIDEKGKEAIRAGVTVVFPKGKNSLDRVFAAWFTLNGNGEMTDTTWIDESGLSGSPILITNTNSVGTVHDAVVKWYIDKSSDDDWDLAVVAKTWDGYFNDVNGFHVKKEHVFEAMNSAKSDSGVEGNVGGGTGMVMHDFKGGIGTSSGKNPTQLVRYDNRGSTTNE